jgi:FAD/FMN-containing dehydrogenase
MVSVSRVQMTGLEGDLVQVAAQTIEALERRLRGRVLLPANPDFEDAIRIWNGMVSKTPAIVVQPLSTDDVREAVRFASANGILLSIKGGGHNIAGTSLADGGVTLDMSRLKTVDSRT